MPGKDSTYPPVSLATTPTPPNLPPTLAVTAAPATRGGRVATRHIAWGRPPSTRRHGRGDHGGATTAGRHRHPERHRPVGARARAIAAAAIDRGGDLHRRPSLWRSGESRSTSVRSPPPPLSSAAAVVARVVGALPSWAPASGGADRSIGSGYRAGSTGSPTLRKTRAGHTCARLGGRPRTGRRQWLPRMATGATTDVAVHHRPAACRHAALD